MLFPLYFNNKLILLLPKSLNNPALKHSINRFKFAIKFWHSVLCIRVESKHLSNFKHYEVKYEHKRW